MENLAPPPCEGGSGAREVALLKLGAQDGRQALTLVSRVAHWVLWNKKPDQKVQ